MSDAELIIEKRGRAGRITLNRPRALNALTHAMIRAMTETLTAWRTDPDVELVVIGGAGDRAFCAGADIRALYAMAKGGDIAGAIAFFRDEYALNHLIRNYPKPYVALTGGVTMGGGVGVSVHGSHRVASDTTLWAMPETGIGLFPDVGMTYVLPRLPHHAGIWLGLTGARLDVEALAALGLATHGAPQEGFPDLIAALERDGVRALDGFTPPVADPLAPYYEEMEAFGADSVEAIMDALAASGSEWSGAQLNALRAMSPTSLKITLEALRRGAGMEFADCLKQELRLAARCAAGPEFAEGVRAQIVDKDRKPRWRPESPGDISPADVKTWFQPLDSEQEEAFAALLRPAPAV